MVVFATCERLVVLVWEMPLIITHKIVEHCQPERDDKASSGE